MAGVNCDANRFSLQWKSNKNAPSSKMIRGSAVVRGTTAYFNSATSKAVYGYDTVLGCWFSLPNCPQQCFALVILKDTLTAVGGFRSIQATNKLQSLTEKSSSGKGAATWTDAKYPAMPTMRGRVAAVSTEDFLVVAGGQLAVVAQIGGVLGRVEVMDITTLQWSGASSLPYGVTEPSMALCSGRLYVMGGWAASDDRTKSVVSCDLDALLESRSARAASPASPSSESSVWSEVADAPSYASTALAVNGDTLLGVGGCDEEELPTDGIYCYDPKSNMWSTVGQMHSSRFRVLAAVLPGNKELLLIGGSSSADGSLTGKGEIVELV